MKYTKDKNLTIKFLVGEIDSKRIYELCSVTGLDTSKVLRMAIQNMYDQIGKISYQSAKDRIINNDKYLEVLCSIIYKLVAPLCEDPLETTYEEAEQKTLEEFIRSGRWYESYDDEKGQSVLQICNTADDMAEEWHRYFQDCEEIQETIEYDRKRQSESPDKLVEIVKKTRGVDNTSSTNPYQTKKGISGNV